MKQIIDGLMYDTDTAEMLLEYENRKLYRTEKNNFFIVYSNEVITPITEANAKAIIGRVNVDRYLEVFDAPEEA